MISGCSAGSERSSTQGLRGAAFTTFIDPAVCDPGSINGINCNHYRCPGDVFINGGPIPSGLQPGTYYFTVLEPGCVQHIADNVSCNLSRNLALSERTFTVNSSGAISAWAASRNTGFTPNGQRAIDLWPFEATTNPGGVYILAICPTGHSDPRDCKFDAFHVGVCAPPPEDGGKVEEDAGGEQDGGEVKPSTNGAEIP